MEKGEKMKKVTRCGGCNKIIRINGSFTAKLVNTANDKFSKVIKLCKTCSSDAGYKVKGVN